MQVTIQQYKANLKGLPKADRIQIIEHELIDRGLLRLARPGEFNPKEVINYLPTDNELNKLKEEIESNCEAYESTTKRKDLIPFMYDRDLNWYFNEKNIPAQEKLVLPTYEYFNEGFGKGSFEPIDFFNILEKQYKDLVANISRPFDVLDSLKAIPLTERERHTLYGFIIMWFGGYPVNNLNEQFNVVLKLIEKEFLNYVGDTPEKEFCKADIEQRNKFIKLGIALTTAINNNMDAIEIMDAMEIQNPQQKEYLSFDELFEAVVKDGLLGEFENKQVYLIERSRYNFTFNIWLQENKGLEYGNEDQYSVLLTKENFIEFMQFEHAEKDRTKFINANTKSAYQIYQDNYNALRKSFRVKRTATKEDCKEMPRLKEGDIIEFEPEYKTTIEAYTLLTEYYAKAYFELEKSQFVETYKCWNEETIKAEIEEIEKFITEADMVSLTEACKVYGSFSKDNELFVYKRFKGKFYEYLELSKYPWINTIGNIEARIYGRYFLFYSFLTEQLKNIQPKNPILADIKNISEVLTIQFQTEEQRRSKIENQLAAIIGKDEKIKYLKCEKEQYLLGLNADTFAASGVTSVKFPAGTELFLDKWITNKIAEIQLQRSEASDELNNNFLKSTIEDWIYQFKDKMSDQDYTFLVSALEQYFTTGLFPVTTKRIQVNGKVNKKLFGWNLNQIYRAARKGNLSKEYLFFAKQNISLFKDVAFDENNILGCNLYKYFTTKTQ